MAVYDGEIIETHSKMTVQEIIELISMMEKKFGQKKPERLISIPM
jgi:ribosomal protein L7/L12